MFNIHNEVHHDEGQTEAKVQQLLYKGVINRLISRSSVVVDHVCNCCINKDKTGEHLLNQNLQIMKCQIQPRGRSEYIPTACFYHLLG